MRTPAGFLYLQIMNIYNKIPLTLDEQIALLESRGLVIKNKQEARHYLQYISYYRLSGYAQAFQAFPSDSEGLTYQGDATFEQVLDAYIFDRKLRLHVIDAIERIEVAIRTVMTNELALKYGPHWYLKEELFVSHFKHADFIQSIYKETSYHSPQNSIKRKKREPFLEDYFKRYQDPELPPVWMIAEILSLGSWSTLFAHLASREDQKSICMSFNLNYIVLTSWLHSLTYLRNLCAHHCRLWNRTFTLKPIIAKQYQPYLIENNRFSAQAAVLKILLDVIAPQNHWGTDLITLISSHKSIQPAQMGFSLNWNDDFFWKE